MTRARRSSGTHGALVRAAQGGDRDALEALIRAHLPVVVAVCHRRLPRDHDIDDAVQETIARSIRALHQVHDPDAFGSWISRVAERTCQDALRREVVPAIVAYRLEEPASPDEVVLRRDEARRVRERLARLGPRDQRALWLRDGLGAPIALVAADLGVTEGSARVLLTRARRRMREAWVRLPCMLFFGNWLHRRRDEWQAALAQVPALLPAALVVAATVLAAPHGGATGPPHASAPAPPQVTVHHAAVAEPPAVVRWEPAPALLASATSTASAEPSATLPRPSPSERPPAAPPALVTVAAVEIGGEPPQSEADAEVHPTSVAGVPVAGAAVFIDDLAGVEELLPDPVPQLP